LGGIDLEPLLSIVVPVYNVEKYLERCLDSLIGQTLSPIEIIGVNDGTRDGCLAILQRYAEKYAHVRVYTKPNGGLGDARNYGLDRARGRYVCFVDSDDYVSPDYAGHLFQAAEKQAADIAVCNYAYAYDDHTDQPVLNFGIRNAIELARGRAEYLKLFLHDDIAEGFIGYNAWTKLFRRSFLRENDLWFELNDEIFAEDMLFMLRALSVANRVAIADKLLYYYYQRPDSIMAVYKPRYFERYKECFTRAEGLFAQNDLRDDLQPFLNARIFHIYFQCVVNAFFAENPYREGRKISRDPWLRQRMGKVELCAMTAKRKIIYWLYKLRIYPAVYLMAKAKAK